MDSPKDLLNDVLQMLEDIEYMEFHSMPTSQSSRHTNTNTNTNINGRNTSVLSGVLNTITKRDCLTVVHKLPVVFPDEIYDTTDHEKETHECPICWESLEDGCVQLPKCAHLFHRICISQWAIDSNTCPVCRKYI